MREGRNERTHTTTKHITTLLLRSRVKNHLVTRYKRVIRDTAGLLSSDWLKIIFIFRIWSVARLWLGQRFISLEKKLKNVFESVANMRLICDSCVTYLETHTIHLQPISRFIWDPYVTMFDSWVTHVWPIFNATIFDLFVTYQFPPRIFLYLKFELNFGDLISIFFFPFQTTFLNITSKNYRDMRVLNVYSSYVINNNSSLSINCSAWVVCRSGNNASMSFDIPSELTDKSVYLPVIGDPEL